VKQLIEDTMTTEQKIIRAKVGLLESGEGGTRPCVSQAAGVETAARGGADGERCMGSPGLQFRRQR
jgi:hypothetical protein